MGYNLSLPSKKKKGLGEPPTDNKELRQDGHRCGTSSAGELQRSSSKRSPPCKLMKNDALALPFSISLMAEEVRKSNNSKRTCTTPFLQV
jgi:hypothetical protein